MQNHYHISLFLLFSLFFSNPISATETKENQSLSLLKDYPPSIINQLRRGQYLEQIISNSLNVIRRTGRDPEFIDEQDIKDIEFKYQQQARKNQIISLLDYDLNNDGKIDKQEISTVTRKNAKSPKHIERENNRLKEIDLNKDNIIDFNEMRTLQGNVKLNLERRTKDLKEILSLDPNSDKKITVTELTEIIKNAYSQIDKDKDNVLSNDEKAELNNIFRNKRNLSSKCPLPYPETQDKKQNYQAYKNKRLTAYLNKGVPEQKSELHIIGSYEGSRRVKVLPGEKPIVLVLASHKPSIWLLDIHPDAKLSEIILQGNGEQKLKNNPENVKVTIRPRGCGSYAYKWFPKNEFEGKTDKKYLAFIQDLQKLTGLIESSFQGAYKLSGQIEVPLNKAKYTEHKIVFVDPSAKTNHKESIEKYKKMLNKLPSDLKPSIGFLIEMMEKGKFPVQFPNVEPGGRGKARYFEELKYNLEKVHKTDSQHPDIDCKTRDIGLLLGDDSMNTINCAWGNQIHWGGNEIDNIDDSWGDDIFNGGKGDDLIDAGWGRDIILFEKNWGTDTVGKTCHHASVSNFDKMYGYETNKNWTYPYVNFIVFGPGIFEKDMAWEGNTLINKKTGDQVIFHDKCFNFVYYEDN